MQCQISVREAGGLRGFGEPCLRVEIAVGVDVDDERISSGVHAQIDAAVVAALQRFERGGGDLDAARFDVARQLGRCGRTLDALGRSEIPLRLVRDDVRLSRERVTETNLGERERAARVVPEQRHVDLAALDEALYQRGLAERAQHLRHCATELLARVHH